MGWAYPYNPHTTSSLSRKPFITFFAAAGLGIAIYWLAAPDAGGSEPQIGSVAPEHKWTDLSGQSADLSFYRGRVVLIDFWATWCDTCQDELPSLQKLYSDYHGQGFELLAPSVDEDGRKSLVPYLAGHPIPWKVLLSDSEDVTAYHVFGLPTKYLINRQGIIVKKYVGSVAPEALAQDVRTALKKNVPSL
jgi:glutathione peroxidase-family protein